MAPSGTRSGSFKRLALSLANNAPLIRGLTWPLLRFKPIVAVGKIVLVTRHADVRDLLSRDEDLTVAEGNGPAMDRVNGPFILGMDRSPRCLRERSLLERCVHDGDADRIRSTVAATAAGLVDDVRASGRIDVVQGLARPTVIRLVRDYFGVTGPDEATMMRWMRTIFHETFLNVGRDPAVRRAGEESGAQFHAYADALIATRQAQIRAGEPTPDDFLTRLVRLYGADGRAESIRRNIGGVVVGAVETTSKAIAHAIDQLVRRKKPLDVARAAAISGDVDQVRQHCWEALRFNPINPVLSRHVARPTVLAAGARHERCVTKGRTVYASVLSAMFDPVAFPEPGTFRADRPVSSYLHFGHGLHACFGRFVNDIQVPEVMAALLRLPNLRPAPAPEALDVRRRRLLVGGELSDPVLGATLSPPGRCSATSWLRLSQS